MRLAEGGIEVTQKTHQATWRTELDEPKNPTEMVVV
jgi:hypothetical protein